MTYLKGDEMVSRNLLFVILIAVFISGCVAASEPSESEIRSEINQRLPSGVDIKTIRYKVFPGESQSAGRIDIAGTIITTEARVERERQNFGRIYKWAESSGMTRDQINRYIRRVCLSFSGCGSGLYEVRIEAGTIIDFTAELSFTETVDGFRFNGRVKHDLCCMPISEIRDSAGLSFVYDTPEFQEWPNRMLYWHNHEEKILPATAEQLFRSSVDGGIITDDSGKVLAIIRLDDVEPAKWATRMIDQGNRYEVTAPLIIEAQSDFSVWYTDIKKGENNLYSIVMTLDYVHPKPENACIRLRQRDTRYGEKQTGEICWNGDIWDRIKPPNNGIVDKRAEKRLSIGPSAR